MYKELYHWNVMDEIEKGKLVCCSDWQKGENHLCNRMTVNALFDMIRSARDDKSNRYHFYYEEESNEKDSVSDESA